MSKIKGKSYKVFKSNYLIPIDIVKWYTGLRFSPWLEDNNVLRMSHWEYQNDGIIIFVYYEMGYLENPEIRPIVEIDMSYPKKPYVVVNKEELREMVPLFDIL